ncbi:hypothetical protein ACTJI2_07855 [Pseudoxanthomonas sp. 22568]|uniref:hypothetical protein n=1 Tax=Pseudoxanthomonas sp. 22568 TaxID=3453945 RepID=UPI003F8737D9
MQAVVQRMERVLLWLGPAVVLAGLVLHRLWEQWPSGRLGDLLVLGLAAWGFAWLIARIWRRPQATGAALFWLLLLLVFAGPIPVLATCLLALAAIALGGFLFAQGPLALQGLLGVLLLAGAAGWLLPWPVHRGWVYLLLCAVLVGWRWRSLTQALRAAAASWNDSVVATPRLAAFCVIVIGLAAVSCWLPSMQYDDLAYHLRLPWQLQEQGFYSPAPQYQVWALAPWLSDVVQSMAQLMAHAEARGAVNAGWLLALGCGLWRLSQHLGGSVTARWLAVATAMCLPLTTALAGGMQTELPSAAALVWLFALVAGPRDGSFRFWLTLAVLAGGLMAIKTTSGAMAAIPVLWALFRHPWPSIPRILLVLLVGTAIAGSSYAYAQIQAGNPVLPLFNAWFKSPYYAPTNFFDARWQTGFGADLFWNMSFDTDRYVEAYDGGGGFLLIALAGPWLLALLHRNTRIATLAATAVLLLPLIPLQYLRYAYPGLVLLSAILATTAFPVDARRAAWLLIGLCVLHLAFQANSHWMLRYGAIKQTVKAGGRDTALLERYAPERLLAERIRHVGGPTGNVLVLDTSQAFFAEFGTRGRTVSWYSPPLSAAAANAAQDPTGRAWVELLRRENISDVILNDETVTPAQRAALQISGATRRAVFEKREWWTLPPGTRP